MKGKNTMVLFSLVGMTDPIRNNYDGPLLHIVRHLKPKKVYLFYTKAITQRDEKDNRYEIALRNIDREIEIIKLKTEITDVHIHENFSRELKKHFYKACENNQSERVIVNVTSGTQQMIAVLSLLIATGRYKVEAYQVSTPERGPNTSSTKSKDYDITYEMANNIDSVYGTDKEINCRVIKTDLLQYKKTMVLRQIKALVQYNYDYIGCLQLMNNSNVIFSSKLKALLYHGKNRLNLNYDKAEVSIDKYDFPVLDYIKDRELSRLVEYYQIIKVKFYSMNYAEMILMLDPFAVAVLKKFLLDILKFDLKKVMSGKKLSVKKLGKHYPKVKRKLDSAYHGFNDSIPNPNNLNIIIKSILEDTGNIDRHKKFFLVIEDLKKLKSFRNVLAHELRTTTIEEIESNILSNVNELLTTIGEQLNTIFNVPDEKMKSYLYLNKLVYEEINNSF